MARDILGALPEVVGCLPREEVDAVLNVLTRQVREEGFTGLLFYPGPHSAQLEALLRDQLGEPGLDGAQIKSWSLDGAVTGN